MAYHQRILASHLAVLIGTSPDRSFLKLAYPSEPILANVSPLQLETIGWGRPLQALCHYIDSAIVDPGFRGELLTKVICLMAMDEALSKSQTPPQSRAHSLSEAFSPSQPPPMRQDPDPSPSAGPPIDWRYTKPIKVCQFLDEMLTPPSGYVSFSQAIKANVTNLKVDPQKLDMFLDGYVFFNHFIPLRRKLSIEAMAMGWNRGAALASTTQTEVIRLCYSSYASTVRRQDKFRSAI